MSRSNPSELSELVIDPDEAKRQDRQERRMARMFTQGLGVVAVCTAVGFLVAVLTVSALARGVEWSGEQVQTPSVSPAAYARIDEVNDCAELLAIAHQHALEASLAAGRDDVITVHEEAALQGYAERRRVGLRC